MIRRRVTGVLASVLLAHVVVSGELSACVDRVGHTAGHTTAAMEPAHDHDAGSTVVSHPAPADAPIPARCCAAMTSCTVALIGAAADDRAAPAASGRRMREVAEQTPASRPRPPDPPPPKAEARSRDAVAA